jgi:hypothetical protein
MSHGGPEIEVPHDHDDPFTKRIALSIAIYAVVIAIAGLGGKDAGKEMMAEQLNASDTWAHYQAKSVRESELKNDFDKSAIMKAQGGLNPGALAILDASMERAKKKLEEYAKEKPELMSKAQEHEKARTKAHKQDGYFDYAELLLQISIVLASVAMLSKAKWPWFTSLVLVLIATILTINGYTLMFHLGFIEGGGH